MTAEGRNPAPYGEGLLRAAEEALTRELRKLHTRVYRRVELEEVMDDLQLQAALGGRVEWRMVAAWLRAHPGVLLRVDVVHSNVVTRLRKANPDLLVMGHNHHFEESGRRVAQLFAMCPREET